MYKSHTIELHSHTDNSDGKLNLKQLLTFAKSVGIEFLAVTDHNTSAAINEVYDGLEDETIPFSISCEWTTYYGHMLALGCDKYVSWEEAKIHNIDEKVQEIKDANGLVGVAHPFDLAGVLCTGCHFEYDVKDWDNINFMEVWSGKNPSQALITLKATRLWTELLDKGHKIAPSYGRDIHWEENENLFGSTVALIKEGDKLNDKSVFEAIKQRKTYVSVGPLVDVNITQDNNNYTIGDVIKDTDFTVDISFDMNSRTKEWKHRGVKFTEVRLITNGNTTEQKSPYVEDGTYTFNVKNATKGKWYRVELWGDYKGVNCQSLMTSAFYVE